MADGRITLETKVDTNGIKQGENTIKNATSRLSSELRKSSNLIAGAMDMGDAKVRRLAENYKKITLEIESQTEKADALRQKMADLQSGKEQVSNRNITSLQNQFDKITASIVKTENEIWTLDEGIQRIQANAFRGPTGEVVLDRSDQASINNINSQLDTLEQKLSTDRAKATELGESLKNAVGAATAAEIDKTGNELQKTESTLDRLKVKAKDTGDKLSESMEKTNKNTSAVTSGFEKMGNKLAGMLKRVFIFSIITKALRGVRTAISNTIKADRELQQSLNKLKAAFWVAFAPLYNRVIPILKTFIEALTRVITTIEKLYAKMAGMSFAAMVSKGQDLQKQSAAGANIGGKTQEEKDIENQIKALEKQNKALNKQKKLKDKLRQQQEKDNKKELADFDEISILTENKFEDENDALDDEIEKNDEIIDQLNEQLELLEEKREAQAQAEMDSAFNSLANDNTDLTKQVENMLTLSGLVCIVLGVICLLSGNFLVGLGFIVMGALQLAVAISESNGNTVGEKIQTFFAENALLITEAAIAMVVLGALFLCLGNIPVGMGLIFCGIGLFAYEIFNNPEAVKQAISDLFALCGEAIIGIELAMIVIGVIFLCVGNLVVGIPLILGGIALLATEMVLAPEATKQAIEDLFALCGEAIIGIELAMIVIGVIFLCVGNLVVGIPLILGGIALLATEIALAPEATKQAIEDLFALCGEAIIGIELAMIVIGICFLCAGMIPIGIGLILGGVALLGAELALAPEATKQAILDFFDMCWEAIEGVNIAMVVLGVGLCLVGVIPKGIGLIVKGINSGAMDVEEQQKSEEFKNMLKKFISECCDVIIKGIDFIKKTVSEFIKGTSEEVTDGTEEVNETLSEALETAGENVSEGMESICDSVGETVEGANEVVKKGVKEAQKSFGELSQTKLDGSSLISSVGAAMSGVGSAVEKGVSSAKAQLNSLFETMSVSGISASGGSLFSVSGVSVPGLANGAVLPANKPFLSVVGDQKNGTNIETPLETMIEAFSIALDSRSDSGGSVEIPLVIDDREFGRAVVRTQEFEKARTSGKNIGISASTKVVYG